MAITYPLNLPATQSHTSVKIRRVSAVSKSVSPFTFDEQVYVFPGQLWEAQITLPAMTRPTAESWDAFFHKLNGMEGTFYMGMPDHLSPQGVGGGSPLVDGNGQLENTLLVKSAPTSTTGWLLQGDFINLGTGSSRRLFKVLDDVDVDGGGAATITVWPKLSRSAPADNDPIEVDTPMGVWRLTENITEVDIDQATTFGLSFPIAREVV